MDVLLLNLTGNRSGWEDENVLEIKRIIERYNNVVSYHAAHGAEAVNRLGLL